MKAKEIFDRLYKIPGIQFHVNGDQSTLYFRNNNYFLCTVKIDMDSEVGLHQNSITFKDTDGK